MSKVDKAFHLLKPICSALQSKFDQMNTDIISLRSDIEVEKYINKVLKSAIGFNDVAVNLAKRLKSKHTKGKTIRRGGGRENQIMVRPANQLARGRATRRKREPKNIHSNPFYVGAGGISIGLITYKLILPLVLKKTPGSVARVTGKLAEVVAVSLSSSASWGSEKVLGVVKTMEAFLTQGWVLPGAPTLTNAHGYAIPQFGDQNEGPLRAPQPFMRVNNDRMPMANTMTNLSNAIVRLNLPKRLGTMVESILESAIDDEVRWIAFYLCIIGGIIMSFALLLWCDSIRSGIRVRRLEAEQRELALENAARNPANTVSRPMSSEQMKLLIENERLQARLMGQMEVMQLMMGNQSGQLPLLLQGMRAGIPLGAGAVVDTMALGDQGVPGALNEQLNE